MTKMLYPVPEQVKQHSFLNAETYAAMYRQSIESPNQFWQQQSAILDWFKAPTIIKNTNFAKDDLHIKWFEDGQLNVSYNCIDRHLTQHAQQTAIIWEGDSPDTDKTITYQALHDHVCRLANEYEQLGDVSTLADPSVVDSLITNRFNH